MPVRAEDELVPAYLDESQYEIDLGETFMRHLSNGGEAHLPHCQVDLAGTFMCHLSRCEEAQLPECQVDLADTFMRHLSNGEEAYLPTCRIDLTGTFMQHLVDGEDEPVPACMTPVQEILSGASLKPYVGLRSASAGPWEGRMYASQGLHARKCSGRAPRVWAVP